MTVLWQHGGPDLERCLVQALQPREHSKVRVQFRPNGFIGPYLAKFIVTACWRWPHGDRDLCQAIFGCGAPAGWR